MLVKEKGKNTSCATNLQTSIASAKIMKDKTVAAKNQLRRPVEFVGFTPRAFLRAKAKGAQLRMPITHPHTIAKAINYFSSR